MNLKINTSVLRELLQLSEKKESLLKELEKIESQIVSCLKGQHLSEIPLLKRNQQAKKENSTTRRYTSSTRKRAPRGSMQKQIFKALAEAGPLGIKIPELSKKIGAKSANIHVWFSNTGKKLPDIERIGAGHFKLRKVS